MASELAPETSVTPVAKATGEQMIETDKLGTADVEFSADLANSGSQDPLSKLGYDPGVARVDEGMSENAYYQEDIDVVGMSSDVNAPPVWNHEFRHRGISLLQRHLKEMDDGERTAWAEKYGQEGIAILNTVRAFEEFSNELFDRPEDDVKSNVPGARFSRMKDSFDYRDTEYGPSISKKNQALMVNVLTDMAVDVLRDQNRYIEPALKKEGPRQKFTRVSRYSTNEYEEAKGWLRTLLGL